MATTAPARRLMQLLLKPPYIQALRYIFIAHSVASICGTYTLETFPTFVVSVSFISFLIVEFNKNIDMFDIIYNLF